jgi:hypothetical protein
MRVVAVTLLLITAVFAASAEDVSIKVHVNGTLQSYDPAAVLRNGTVYVPLRQGAASLGTECRWVPEQNMAKLCTHSSCVFVPKSGGIVVNGSLLLPLRKMGEALGASVAWDAGKQTVTIQSGTPPARRGCCG